jgi:hypothetical protein
MIAFTLTQIGECTLMEKNVLIPIPLVKRIVELLGYWDVSMHDCAIRDECSEIMQALDLKMRKLELRDAYSKMINAGNENSRHEARINYLWLKSRLNDISASDHIS